MADHADGDPGALRELYLRHAQQLRSVLAVGLPQRDDAHDLVQTTFLQVHRARRDYRRGAPFRPWLYTIALNLKREQFRRRARRPETPLDPVAEEQLRDPAASPEDAAEAGRVRRAVSELPTKQRDVIILHWFGGFGFPEVAAVLAASLSAVKVRAHRGYARLREVLGPSHVTAGAPPAYKEHD